MKITFVCKYLGKGGAERVMSILIRYFVSKGYNVQLILLFENLIEYEIPKEVQIDCFNWRRCKSPLEAIKRTIQLRKSIQGDYVISFLYAAIRDVVFATLGQNKTIIVSDRNDPSKEPAGRYRQVIRDISYYFADIIVFQTEDAKCFFSKAIQKKGHIIANPINSRLPEPFFGERDKTIIAAGRLDKQKNFALLLNAFALFHADHPDYSLKIYGRGPLEKDLQELSKNLKIDSCTEFPGFVLDINEKMKKASIYVSSSDFEGISNSMLEALALGVPSICTDCPVGGAAMVIKDGINGRLVPVGDINALYKAMKFIVENPDKAAEYSHNALLIRNEYSESKICREWEKLLE